MLREAVHDERASVGARSVRLLSLLVDATNNDAWTAVTTCSELSMPPNLRCLVFADEWVVSDATRQVWWSPQATRATGASRPFRRLRVRHVMDLTSILSCLTISEFLCALSLTQEGFTEEGASA